MNPTDLTADDLLKITPHQVGKLFTDLSNDGLAKTFRALASKWHPDRNKDKGAVDVFQHINALHQEATRQRPATLELKDGRGKTILFHYLRKRETDTGAIYIAATNAILTVHDSLPDLFKRGKWQMNNFTYPSPAIKKQAASFLPFPRAFEYKADKADAITIYKDASYVILSDMVEFLGGTLEPRTAAWVISRLYNIACYLQVTGLTHNDMCMDNMLVDPESHNIILVGGWWFATPEGDKLTTLPARTVGVVPQDVLNAKRATSRIDLETIRLLGRELLGDPTGTKILHNKTIPKAFSQWFTLPTSGDALEDYKGWQKVLTKSFGPRKFTEAGVRAHQVYPSLNQKA